MTKRFLTSLTKSVSRVFSDRAQRSFSNSLQMRVCSFRRYQWHILQTAAI